MPVRLRLRDLLLARISRDDAIEPPCQSDCCLSVARPAIPGELAARRKAAEILKHLAWISRPKFRVIRRLLREVILKGHARRSVISTEVENGASRASDMDGSAAR